MCGLAGLIHVTGDSSIDSAAVVRRMCELQAYRGPDDSGVMDLGRVCLGSQRLSIIDLSEAGHMPMSDQSGRWWIAYNGEIYNFAEIREELHSLGHTFRSHTDTEVILHSWMEWGSDCLKRFIGMFAFAIHDRTTDEVVLVRDRYGKKPLYYARKNGIVYFSSEIKGLAFALGDTKIDQSALYEWFLYRNVDALASRTLFEQVQAVLPGQIATFSPRGIHTQHYYEPTEHVAETEFRRYESASPAQIVAEVEELLDDAVRQRLVSDVPVGTFLSGGLDSSLVTSIAARHTQELTAFHISVAGYPEHDERRYAEQLASELGLRFVPFELTGSEFRKALPYVAWLEDLPITHANSTGYYLISKVARAHGVPVVLSGEGADELFGGYSWNYRRRQRYARLRPFLNRLPERLYQLLALLVYAQSGMPFAAHRFRYTLPATVDLIDRNLRVEWLARCEAAYEFVPKEIDRHLLGAMLSDISNFLAPLLRRLDRTSMGASVESRVPFLDHRVVHAAINLPLDYKVGRRADKWVVKQIAMKYMPRSLVTRKKTGFPLPLADYIAPLAVPEFFAGGFCESNLGLSSNGILRAMTAWRKQVDGLFGFIAFELWGRIHVMGESFEQAAALIEECESRHARASRGVGG